VGGCLGVWACTCVYARASVQLSLSSIQRACFIHSFVVSLVPLIISKLSHEGHNVRKNVPEYKMRVLILSTTFI
jgi:hypothetical protein